QNDAGFLCRKVRMEKRFYPVDYLGCCCGKRGGKRGVKMGGKHCAGHSVLNTSVTRERTASIQESGTLVLEDLKALRWKTCQE
nr:hypothetical protein [Tanacetum cinerariifolium]